MRSIFVWLVAGVVWAITPWAWCQDGTQPPSHVRLPWTFGGTPLSYQINAQAAYMVAAGDMIESVAVARKIHAEAFAKEIENSKEYVRAFFERRAINQEEWRREHPDAMETEKRRQETKKRLVLEQYQRVLQGDVTATLNWLLRELANPMVAYRYLRERDGLANSKLDEPLSLDDLKLIRLTDGGRGSQLVASAASGQVLETHWPLALRDARFDVLRQQFEDSRKQMLAEAGGGGEVSNATSTKILQDVNALLVALEEAYPQERRADPAEYRVYYAAERFLKTLVANVHRAITTKDKTVFSGKLRYDGKSMVELIQHMYESGLEFAPPEPGGEGVYNKLFQSMRTLYANIGLEAPLVGAGKP